MMSKRVIALIVVTALITSLALMPTLMELKPLGDKVRGIKVRNVRGILARVGDKGFVLKFGNKTLRVLCIGKWVYFANGSRYIGYWGNVSKYLGIGDEILATIVVVRGKIVGVRIIDYTTHVKAYNILAIKALKKRVHKRVRDTGIIVSVEGNVVKTYRIGFILAQGSKKVGVVCLGNWISSNGVNITGSELAKSLVNATVVVKGSLCLAKTHHGILIVIKASEIEDLTHGITYKKA